MEEHDPGPSDIGSVVVDIGGDHGAAIVWTSTGLLGAEIEIRPVGEGWDGTHVAVHERHTGDGTRCAALYGSLPAGAYQLRRRPPVEGGAVVGLVVEAGRVVEVTWPP